MKKDIYIPESKGIKLAIISQEACWDLYLINENDFSIRNILIVTEANSEDRQTSKLRYFLEGMGEHSFIKFESIFGEVIEFDNQITITYYRGLDIYEKEFEFTKSSFQDEVHIPLLERRGILIP